MGCAAAIVFSGKTERGSTRFLTLFFRIAFGAAYGTAKSGVGLCAMGVMRPELMIKNVIPIVMVSC